MDKLVSLQIQKELKADPWSPTVFGLLIRLHLLEAISASGLLDLR